jgi:hypothetical protein
MGDLLSFLYNDCSIGNALQPDEGARNVEFEVEPVQSTPREEGFMFEGFLRSITTLFSGMFVKFSCQEGLNDSPKSQSRQLFLPKMNLAAWDMPMSAPNRFYWN